MICENGVYDPNVSVTSLIVAPVAPACWISCLALVTSYFGFSADVYPSIPFGTSEPTGGHKPSSAALNAGRFNARLTASRTFGLSSGGSLLFISRKYGDHVGIVTICRLGSDLATS